MYGTIKCRTDFVLVSGAPKHYENISYTKKFNAEGYRTLTLTQDYKEYPTYKWQDWTNQSNITIIPTLQKLNTLLAQDYIRV